MKKTIAFLAFSFTALSIYGQFEWIGDFGFSSSTRDVYRTRNNQYIVVRDAEDQAGFTVFDSSWAIVFNYTDPFTLNHPNGGGQGRQEILDIMEMPDTSIIFIARNYNCVVPYESYHDYQLIHFDTQWGELTLEEDPFFTFPTHDWFGAPLSNGDFVLFSEESEMQGRDAQGKVLWQEFPSFYFTEIHDFISIPGDTLIAATDFGTMILDRNGILLTSFDDHIFHQVKSAPNGTLAAQSVDSLVLFTTQFERIQSVGFTDGIVDFSVFDGSYYILLKSDSVVILDASFGLQNGLPVQSHDLTSHIEAADNKFIIISTECFWNVPEGTCSPIVKEYDKDGTASDLRHDAGVIGAAEVSPPHVLDPPAGHYKLTYDSLRVTVFNFGDEVIDSLKLNARFPTLTNGSLCRLTYQYYHQKFSGLALAPGGSIDLYWEDFSVFFQSEPTQLFDICLWTSLPNGAMEDNIGNDGFCSGFLVNQEEISLGYGFHVSPNPSFGHAIVRYSIPFGQKADILVLNNLGQPFEKYATASEKGDLFLPQYPSGVYYIIMQAEGRVLQAFRYIQL